jgi:hypothetical protein
MLSASFLVALGSLAPACGRPGSGPALEVADPRADLGIVSEGEVLEHEWLLSVRLPARVREAKSDCGCTLTRLELERGGRERSYELGEELVPGDRLRLHVRYDTLGRSGLATRTVQLVLGDGLQTLALTADVRPWLRADPAVLGLARVREGAELRSAFHVSSLSGEVFALRATRRALPPWVSLWVEPLEGSRQEEGRAALWKVEAVLSEKAPRGLFSYPLELMTDVPIPGASSDGVEPRRHGLAPTWSVQVVGPVALSQASLEFGLVGERETVAQSLRLESFDGAYSPALVKARLTPLHDGDPFPLGRTARVHVRPGPRECDIEVVLGGLDDAVQGTFLAKLVVETGHSALPELEALVRGTAAPRDRQP